MASTISALQNMSSGGAVGGTGYKEAPAVPESGTVTIGGGHANPAGGGSAATGEIKKNFDQVWNEVQSKYGGKEEKHREAKKSLGKDDFLKIMLTQLQHQDPTKPMEADKMATEMAQMTSVEQLQNVNKAIENLATKSSALDKLTMAGLIGKNVTIDRNRFPHQENSRETLNFTLPEDAQSVKATIIADSGETIFEKDLGVQKAGENSFLWDGKKLNTIAAKAGNYTLRIDAKGANEKTIIPATQVKTSIIGVNFEGENAVLLVGNPQKPEKVELRSVIKIDGGSSGVGMPTAGGGSAPAAGAPGKPPSPLSGGSFFSFTPGVGSKPLDPAALSPAARAAFEKMGKPPAESADAEGAEKAEGGQVVAQGEKSPGLQQAMAQAMQQMGQQMGQDSKEKGFPSGLGSE